jgi:hypothetical protein
VSVAVSVPQHKSTQHLTQHYSLLFRHHCYWSGLHSPYCALSFVNLPRFLLQEAQNIQVSEVAISHPRRKQKWRGSSQLQSISIKCVEFKLHLPSFLLKFESWGSKFLTGLLTWSAEQDFSHSEVFLVLSNFLLASMATDDTNEISIHIELLP